jgi:hypothetical protein
VAVVAAFGLDISDSDSLLEPCARGHGPETIAVSRHHFTLGAWPIAFNVPYHRRPFPDTQPLLLL